MNLEDLKKQTIDPAYQLIYQALIADAAGNWERAHQFAQEDHSQLGSWMHAYLHRKEGDLGNTRYWYSQSGRLPYAGSLEEEWQTIALACLAK
ncbi:MAG TPA: hypothetical protein PKD72_11575 [Gemmatales bacterium]|nr:hypothetical protein [Gemmatales bacterium]